MSQEKKADKSQTSPPSRQFKLKFFCEQMNLTTKGAPLNFQLTPLGNNVFINTDLSPTVTQTIRFSPDDQTLDVLYNAAVQTFPLRAHAPAPVAPAAAITPQQRDMVIDEEIFEFDEEHLNRSPGKK